MSIYDPLIKEAFRLRREGRDIFKVHISENFFKKMLALASENNRIVKETDTVLGRSFEIHKEPCEKEWWFELSEYVKISNLEIWRKNDYLNK